MGTTPLKPRQNLGLAQLARGRRRTSGRRSAPEVEVQPTRYYAGDVIAGKYRLTSVLGEGGMGSVWLARNLALDADVAVKLIRREIRTAEAAGRLLQEARAAARLGHPAIVRVFDFGETEYHEPFIVMELLCGESLGDVLDREVKLAEIESVQALLPVISALVVAHAKGIVHRDLKPENIVLVTDEAGIIRPKIVDFGIAKLTAEPMHESAPELVLGSPDYMAPEQARGQHDIDHRADIWAMAVVLYEMIAGCRPFDGPNYHALLQNILTLEPAPTTVFGCDDGLWEIIRRGLEKDRAARWQSMRQFGQALARWALRNQIAHDIAGTSIALHWFDKAAKRSFSPLGRRAQPSPKPRLALVSTEVAPLSELARDGRDLPTTSPIPGRGVDRAEDALEPGRRASRPPVRHAADDHDVGASRAPRTRKASPLKLLHQPAPVVSTSPEESDDARLSTRHGHAHRDPAEPTPSHRPFLAVHLADEPTPGEIGPLGTSAVVPARGHTKPPVVALAGAAAFASVVAVVLAVVLFAGVDSSEERDLAPGAIPASDAPAASTEAVGEGKDPAAQHEPAQAAPVDADSEGVTDELVPAEDGDHPGDAADPSEGAASEQAHGEKTTPAPTGKTPGGHGALPTGVPSPWSNTPAAPPPDHPGSMPLPDTPGY